MMSSLVFLITLLPAFGSTWLPSPAAATPAVAAVAPASWRAASRRDSLRTDGEIRMTVLRNAADVRRCYEREGLRRNPALHGTIEVEITILPTGVVEHAEVSASPALEGSGTGEVASCIAIAARNWRFERGPFDVEIVTFPFALAPDAMPAGTSRIASD